MAHHEQLYLVDTVTAVVERCFDKLDSRFFFWQRNEKKLLSILSVDCRRLLDFEGHKLKTFLGGGSNDKEQQHNVCMHSECGTSLDL